MRCTPHIMGNQTDVVYSSMQVGEVQGGAGGSAPCVGFHPTPRTSLKWVLL